MNLFDLSAVLTLDSSQYERGIQNARGSASGLTSSMNGVDGALEKTGQGFTVFKGVLSNVVSSGINLVASALRDNLGNAISRVDTLNNYTKVMENLGVKADVSDKALDKLVAGIQDLPTALPAIASLQQQFFALNGSMKDSSDIAIALNDATLAGGQGQEAANSAMQQWYQIIANGKPDMQSWRIINMAMPAQLKQISQELLGTSASAEDLRTAWMDGKVSTEEVTDALVKLDQKGGKGVTAFADQARSATAGIQTGMQNLKTAISTGLANILDEFGGEGGKNFKEFFDTIKVGIKGSFGEIVTIIQNIKEFGLAEAFSMEIEKAQDAVTSGFFALFKIDWSNLFSTAFKGLGNAFSATYEAMLQIDTLRTNLVTRIMELAGQMITGFIDGVIQNGPALIEQGVNAVMNFNAGIYENMSKMAESASSLINKLVEYLSKNSDKIATTAVKMVIALGRGIITNAPKILSSVAKLGATIVKGILKIAPKLPPLAIKMVVSLANALVRQGGKLLNSAKGMAQKAVDGIKNAFSNVADIGLNLVKGVANGITNGTGWIKSKIKSWVGNVKSFLKSLFGISSPSKWARDIIGLNIDKGLALGIEQNADMVDDAMDDLMPDIERSGFSLTSNVPASGNGVKISYPTVNEYVTVDGAENPDEWGVRFADRLKMELRTV